MRTKTYLALCALALVATSSLQSATIYTDQATFLGNTQPGYYLETFNSLLQGDEIPPPILFSGNGFSYEASTTLGDFFNIGPAGDTWLSTDQFAVDIVFTLTSGNVTAMGGYFFLTDLDGNVIAGTITVNLDDGSTFSLLNPSPTSFIGFTTTSPILSLTVTLDDPDSFVTINDLIVGAAVPEPGTGLMILGGLGTLIAWRRWRRDP